MKALAIITLLLITAAPGKSEWIHLGENFTLDEETSIPELVEHPEKYHNRIVRINGIIASVCNEEGCFIEVIPEDGNSEGIIANFPGLIFLTAPSIMCMHLIICSSGNSTAPMVRKLMLMLI